MKNDMTNEELAEIERLILVAKGAGPSVYDRNMAAHELVDRVERLAAEMRTLRAPVDVEGEVERAARRITQTVLVTAFKDDEGRVVVRLSEERAAHVVRPHVERAAQLAREAEGLRKDLNASRLDALAARAGLAQERYANQGRVAQLNTDLAAARAEIERLKGEVKR